MRNETKSITLESIKKRVNEILFKIEKDTNEHDGKVQSWVRKDYYYNLPSTSYPTNKTKYFDLNGFLVIPSFLSEAQVKEMKDEMISIIDKDWHPNYSNVSIFRTDEKQVEAQGSDNYFLSSSNKVHFFAESSALKEDKVSLKPEFQRQYKKHKALNKVGHGIHLLPDSSFHSYATGSKFKTLIHEMGYQNPTIPQSMYIFKHKSSSSEVTSHQDSTFLHTSPNQTCLGCWLALDEVTLQNGCLWIRPKSFQEGLRRKFIRNKEYFQKRPERDLNLSSVSNSNSEMSMLLFEELQNSAKIPWEGDIPSFFDQKTYTKEYLLRNLSTDYFSYLLDLGFVPILCNPGDLVLFNGEMDHFSLPSYHCSTSESEIEDSKEDTGRHTFQLHLIEGEEVGITWDSTNWLQYPTGCHFLKI